MQTINYSDSILATATLRGQTIASFRSSGFSCVSDVLKAIRFAAGSAIGLVNINIFNATRCWTQRTALFIAPQKPGVQLSLF